MPKVTFYTQGCTRKIRFRDSSLLEEFLSSNHNNLTKIEVDIEGCVITQSTGYFDFKAPLLEDTLATPDILGIQRYTYIKYEMVVGEEPYKTYFMFVDRIEINNFSGENTYYRCYFTIDWWSTLNNDTSRFVLDLEGKVERAHINDVRYEPELGYYIADLIHTSSNNEEEITKEQVQAIQLPDTIDDISWAYVITNSAYEGGTPKFEWTAIVLREEMSVANTPLVVYPIRKGRVCPYRLLRLDGNYTNVTGGFPISELTDKEVLGIFYSKIPPTEVLSYDKNAEFPIVIRQATSGAVNKYLEVAGKEAFTDAKSGLQFSGITGITFDLDSLMLNRPFYKSNEFSIPQTYNDYLQNNIVKYHSSAYKTIMYRSAFEGHIIDPMFMIKNTPIYCNVNMATGATFLSYPNLLRSDMSISTYSIGENVIFQPTRSVDKFEIIKAIASMGTAYLTASKKEGITSWQTKLNIAINGKLGLMEAQRGETNATTTPQQHDYGTSETNIIYSIPLNSLNILEHLALYGYDTDLHPNDILKDHKRKVFNYIKTKDCICLNTDINESIRIELEKMFNDGVWFWNESEGFGNFYVPNYPLIMEEEHDNNNGGTTV